MCSIDIKYSAYFSNRHKLELNFIVARIGKRKVCTALPDFIVITNKKGALNKRFVCLRITFEYIPLKKQKLRMFKWSASFTDRNSAVPFIE